MIPGVSIAEEAEASCSSPSHSDGERNFNSSQQIFDPAEGQSAVQFSSI